MSMLQGTLTVVVATVIASGMIVLTGNGIADDKEGEKANVESIVFSEQSKGASKKITVLETSVDEADSKISANVGNSSPLAPPPGPFLNEDKVSSAQKSLVAPVAPKAPIASSKQLETRPRLAAPSLSQRVVKPKADLSKPHIPEEPSIGVSLPQLGKKMELVAPTSETLKQAIMPKLNATAPIAPKSTAKQPSVNSAERPIWMQEGKITEKGMDSPSKNTVQQNQAGMRTPEMGWNNNYPRQQYIYVPVPMMPSNMNPPQMPMFNGNIIPPSNYWGAPMPPKNNLNTIIQKESTEKGSK